MSAALTGCSDDYAQPPVVLPEGGVGNGLWDSPLTAYQAGLGTTPDDRTENWVTGFIVGWVDTNINSVLKEETAKFDVPAGVATNILIAASPDERDWEKCVPVQLPSGAVRNALSLATNPEMQGVQVSVYGTTGSKYCSAYGVRSVSAYALGDKGTEPDPSMILPPGSFTLWTATLTTDMQGFTFDQGENATFDIWTHSTSYGLVANGNRKEGAGMAISPEIDLTRVGSPRVMVHQAANYFNNVETFLEYTQTLVREVGGEWVEVEVPLPPAGNSWSFSDSGYINLDLFAGKKIQIGFYYKSTATLSGAWEIDRVTVTGVPNQ